IEDIFHEAIKLDPTNREAYLKRACAGDKQLEICVAELLKHAEGQGILDRPAIEILAQTIAAETVPYLFPKTGRLKPGERLFRYEIIADLPGGGMSQVYLARDIEFDWVVAIKVLHPDFSNRPDFASLRERFKREAAILSGIKDSNICTIYDIRHDEGIDYIVMEYIEGET